jgi:signal transduction histidine kinase
MREGAHPTEPERARRTLAAGILVFRWGALAWMFVLALTGGPFERPGLLWATLGVAALWTVRLTFVRGPLSAADRWADLGISIGLIVMSALLVGEGEVSGPRPFVATMYPASAALTWGAERGPGPGVIVGAVLAAALLASRPLNGLPLDELDANQIQQVANGMIYMLLAGGATGVISRLLDRSSAELRAATKQAIRERERAARYAERESLAREIHDSVLQALALVHKRGRELGARGSVQPDEVLALAQTAGDQERALRELLLREPEPAPGGGTASLRDALEAAAREVHGVPVTVSAVGPIWLPGGIVAEIVAAVGQALANVEAHAKASRATVFAEAAEGWISVNVRDDGVGFVMDPEKLRADGRGGILKSVMGRITDLGGDVRITTAPGEGTELELRVPETASG